MERDNVAASASNGFADDAEGTALPRGCIVRSHTPCSGIAVVLALYPMDKATALYVCGELKKDLGHALPVSPTALSIFASGCLYYVISYY